MVNENTLLIANETQNTLCKQNNARHYYTYIAWLQGQHIKIFAPW